MLGSRKKISIREHSHKLGGRVFRQSSVGASLALQFFYKTKEIFVSKAAGAFGRARSAPPSPCNFFFFFYKMREIFLTKAAGASCRAFRTSLALYFCLARKKRCQNKINFTAENFIRGPKPLKMTFQGGNNAPLLIKQAPSKFFCRLMEASKLGDPEGNSKNH